VVGELVDVLEAADRQRSEKSWIILAKFHQSVLCWLSSVKQDARGVTEKAWEGDIIIQYCALNPLIFKRRFA